MRKREAADGEALDDSNGFTGPDSSEENSLHQSPTLEVLEPSRRPRPSTVCERCPASLWFASPDEVKCYCRVMHLLVWTTKEPNQLTHCDGLDLAQEE